MVEKKISARSQDPSQRRILDRATRQRRLNRQLEALENDNFQDDPHANMPQLVKRLPQFDDDAETGKKKKKTRGDHFKLRFRKNFQALLEEQVLEVDSLSYAMKNYKHYLIKKSFQTTRRLSRFQQLVKASCERQNNILDTKWVRFLPLYFSRRDFQTFGTSERQREREDLVHHLYQWRRNSRKDLKLD
ncbi:hypothetical protein Chor_009596 [Crotalus horridus]